jgi:hypothetical protein
MWFQGHYQGDQENAYVDLQSPALTQQKEQIGLRQTRKTMFLAKKISKK